MAHGVYVYMFDMYLCTSDFDICVMKWLIINHLLLQDSLSQSVYACFQSTSELERDVVINPLHCTFECPDARLITNSKPSK